MRKRFVIMLMLIAFSLCLYACDENAKATVNSNSSDGGNSSIAVSISVATDKQISNTTDYIHFYDRDNINTDWKIVITVNEQIDGFEFLELDDSDALSIGKTLYQAESPKIGEAYIFHTYINDATLNRAVSYKDKNGQIKYFGIECNMNNGSVSLKEIKF